MEDTTTPKTKEIIADAPNLVGIAWVILGIAAFATWIMTKIDGFHPSSRSETRVYFGMVRTALRLLLSKYDNKR